MLVRRHGLHSSPLEKSDGSRWDQKALRKWGALPLTSGRFCTCSLFRLRGEKPFRTVNPAGKPDVHLVTSKPLCWLLLSYGKMERISCILWPHSSGGESLCLRVPLDTHTLIKIGRAN